jgi:hypothetical protein
MKAIYLFIFLLILAVPLLSHAQNKTLCEQYTCVATWNFGSYFGFGGGTTFTPAESGSYILLEDGNNLVTEAGDKITTE